MAKEELIQFEGLVTEILPDARYRVQLDAGHEIVAYTAGKMKKNRIKTLAGDRVTIEMSPYDLEKGRLIFRHKDERSVPPPVSVRVPVTQQKRARYAHIVRECGRLAGRIKKSCTSGLF
jgi:translation initiation factor IF-1